MRRRYLRQVFADKVIRIKELMTDACIGADVIVGFPGETDEDFLDECSFIQNLPLSYLHVFTYSERPGTPASVMPGRVPERIRNERSKALHRISTQLKIRFYQTLIGQDHVVLFEQKQRDGTMVGFTENYAEVVLPWNPSLLNKAVRVRIDSQQGEFLTGSLIPSKS
jgi:threonylcarbamoyladenosine tRNA methylthiotransferase MtaB